MIVIRWFINFICATVAIFTVFYLAVSVAITYFILTGQLTVGKPMYFETDTPDIPGLLTFQAVSIVIIICCVLIRAIVGKKYDFKFLQPKDTEHGV